VAAEVDLVVGTSPDAIPMIVSEPLREEVVTRALIPSSHRLAGQQSVRAADLGDLPFLVPPRGVPAPLIELGLAQLRAVGMRSPLLTLESGIAGAHLMVAAGRGWFVVSETMA